MVYSAKEARAFAEHECGGRAVMKPFVGMRGLNVTLLDLCTLQHSSENQRTTPQQSRRGSKKKQNRVDSVLSLERTARNVKFRLGADR
eukprot:5149443-Amphidinium_carterae.1